MQGVIPEERVDSFNVPVYFTSAQELEAVVEQNGCFSIERMEHLPHMNIDDSVLTNFASHLRAVLEGLIKQHFGEEILDELFDLYSKKFEQQRFMIESGRTIQFFVALKRKEN